MSLEPTPEPVEPTQASGNGTGELFRRCVRCDQWKSQRDFHNSSTGQFSYCRDCRREYDRRYYAERGRGARRARQRAAVDAARAWMAELKAGRPCADCGGVFPVYVMHWDHLPGFVKAGEISVMVTTRTRAAVIAELEKCELVCANCHVMRTVTGHNPMSSSVAI